MTPAELERWQTAQIAAAIERGVNPLDAARAMVEFMASVPYGADPATHIRPALALEQNITDDAVLADVRSAWYSEVDPRVARLLDAKTVD